MYDVTDKYIMLDPPTTIFRTSSSFRHLVIHVPFQEAFQFQEAIPEALWDHTDRVFLRPIAYHWSRYPTLAVRFSVHLINATVQLVLLCGYREAIPILKVFDQNTYLRESNIIFQQRYRENGINWEDLEIQAPGVCALKESMTLKIEHHLFVVTVLRKKGTIQHMSHDMDVWSLYPTIIEVGAG